MIVCEYKYYSHFFSVGALCFTKKSYKKGCDNHVNYKRNNARKPLRDFLRYHLIFPILQIDELRVLLLPFGIDIAELHRYRKERRLLVGDFKVSSQNPYGF